MGCWRRIHGNISVLLGSEEDCVVDVCDGCGGGEKGAIRSSNEFE